MAFKVWKLKPSLKVIGITLLVLLTVGILFWAFLSSGRPIITIGQLLALVLVTAASYAVGENVVRAVRFRDTIHKVLAGIGLCLGGFIVAWVHLGCFDKMYLRLGEAKRIANK